MNEHTYTKAYVPMDAAAFVDGEIEGFESETIGGQRRNRRTVISHALFDGTSVRVLLLKAGWCCLPNIE